ncbi:sigma-70 family RNA polymerase sigma factor [Pseudenhygromyxa sp. WMMC2535]|uniref:RNA polymerase sigma factor n=1 Tax=Pseudenhygromyxa sp. WMMC2535 TaxID=2712867 RepID=UPI001596100A|nr:sigma-70 family RNA polymerase sigma factor [Pseudenhygromyxa sp. WMMC2535]NVB38220.1 sigma-70 family RNA polymerase sigma factor [Pseudenhygromyxa sp. WMMC2535]NVB41619.1 sigma-70 family RNA polymerase sigma factor [Pseudenhygromyxa sp. WMMC2535]NVB43643.1 sigma-70 family RNA polymerase sigma factor [Pseudenhygromyxa sp. WMMC2535]NVB43668.1 sigma-70 family RNA polymerase sigma factor [Pseudenhygromyxa sp. WMMC2535]
MEKLRVDTLAQKPGASQALGKVLAEELERMLGSGDLTHDAFLAVWEKIWSFEPRQEDSLLRWLRVTAKNKRLQAHQSQVRRPWVQLEAEPLARDKSPSQELEMQEQASRLESAVAKLGSIFVRALRHRLAGGRPEALAQAESIQLSTARWRMGEVVRQLRRLLDESQRKPRVSLSSSSS